MFLQHLSIRKKLIVGSAIILLLLAVVSSVSILSVRKISSNASALPI